MTIAGLIIGLCIILLMCWLVQTYLPVPWKTPVLVIIVILALVWLASAFFPSIGATRIR